MDRHLALGCLVAVLGCNSDCGLAGGDGSHFACRGDCSDLLVAGCPRDVLVRGVLRKNSGGEGCLVSLGEFEGGLVKGDGLHRVDAFFYGNLALGRFLSVNSRDCDGG